MNSEIPEDRLAGIRAALFQERKIEAIKLYREYTSTGLADAKDAVEKLEVELRSQSPEKFSTKPAAGKGCLGVILAVCVLIIVVVLWLAGD